MDRAAGRMNGSRCGQEGGPATQPPFLQLLGRLKSGLEASCPHALPSLPSPEPEATCPSPHGSPGRLALLGVGAAHQAGAALLQRIRARVRDARLASNARVVVALLVCTQIVGGGQGTQHRRWALHALREFRGGGPPDPIRPCTQPAYPASFMPEPFLAPLVEHVSPSMQGRPS